MTDTWITFAPAVISGLLGAGGALAVRRADTREKTTSALRDQRLQRHAIIMEDARTLRDTSLSWALGYQDELTGQLEYPDPIGTERIESAAAELELLSPLRLRKALETLVACAVASRDTLSRALIGSLDERLEARDLIPDADDNEQVSAILKIIEKWKSEIDEEFTSRQNDLRKAIDTYAVEVRREMGVSRLQARERPLTYLWREAWELVCAPAYRARLRREKRLELTTGD